MSVLTDHSCSRFSELLASGASVPGGGGAAALCGALGVSLCSMVGNFTTGKKKYAAVEADVQRMLAEGETLRARLLELVEEDAAAFEPLSKAYAIPKDAPERAEVLRRETLNACKAPLEMMRCCGKAIELIAEMEQKGSVLLVSDAGCAAAISGAALESAAMNVFVNTGALQGDPAAAKLQSEAEALLEKYLPRARETADSVLGRIRK